MAKKDTEQIDNRQVLIADGDTIPLPIAKLARRIAQLPEDGMYEIKFWREKGRPKWVIKELGKIEGGD